MQIKMAKSARERKCFHKNEIKAAACGADRGAPLFRTSAAQKRLWICVIYARRSLFNIYSANDKKDDVGQEIHFSLGDGDAVLMLSARWGFFLASLSLTPHTHTTLCPHAPTYECAQTHTHTSLFSP
jgi:hypothetical protein